MDNEYAKHEIRDIRRYEALGYTDQYQMVGDQLENLESKKRYSPQDVMLLKEQRYEGMSNPDDMSLLYVIRTMDGSKGTILASYGATGENAVHEFMNLIPEENTREELMFPPEDE